MQLLLKFSSVLIIGLLALLPFGQTSFAQSDGIEITEVSNSAELGINESFVYLNVTRNIVIATNRELQERYQREYQEFVDSQGKLIISEPVLLRSTRITVPMDNIEAINIRDGNISFDYLNTPAVKFEEILTENGQPILNSFQPEELEKFRAYLISSK